MNYCSKLNDKTTTTEVTPLMIAITGSQIQCTEQLLKNGASLYMQDNSGETAYHYAVKHHPKCIPVSSSC
jgi:ankyrin repeat protein